MNERNARTQEMLKAEGLYKGKIDGIIGPLTRKALELHNKQQYQPLPRQRPSGVSAKGSAAAGGGPAPEMAARGRIASPMPPMPDSGVPAAPDFDALKAEMASARVNPNPNRFGPELAGLGAPSPPPASFNKSMRATLGMPPALPPTPDQARNAAATNALIRQGRPSDRMSPELLAALNAESGVSESTPDQLGAAQGLSLPSLDQVRSQLADWGIIEQPTPLSRVLSGAVKR